MKPGIYLAVRGDKKTVIEVFESGRGFAAAEIAKVIAPGGGMMDFMALPSSPLSKYRGWELSPIDDAEPHCTKEAMIIL